MSDLAELGEAYEELKASNLPRLSHKAGLFWLRVYEAIGKHGIRAVSSAMGVPQCRIRDRLVTRGMPVELDRQRTGQLSFPEGVEGEPRDELKKISQAVAHWRRTKRHRFQKIPDALRSEVEVCAAVNGVEETAHACSINTRDRANWRTRIKAWLIERDAKNTGEDAMGNGDALCKSHWLKTCPSCSRRAGYLVWLPYPEAFGVSTKRARSGAQSHCTRCRTRAAEVNAHAGA